MFHFSLTDGGLLTNWKLRHYSFNNLCKHYFGHSKGFIIFYYKSLQPIYKKLISVAFQFHLSTMHTSFPEYAENNLFCILSACCWSTKPPKLISFFSSHMHVTIPIAVLLYTVGYRLKKVPVKLTKEKVCHHQLPKYYWNAE